MNNANLAAGVPCEMQTVSVTGHRQDEGQGIMIDHIIPYIVQLSIKTCREEKKKGNMIKLISFGKKTINPPVVLQFCIHCLSFE